MRIWDISPGYLNRNSLLGEHNELHALVSICLNNKKGYAHHPETLRWKDYLGALAVRHELLVAEMTLRGYAHQSPLSVEPDPTRWPVQYVDPPARQFALLREKYRAREPGRIPLPNNAQELWAHHKYSVLARDPNLYRKLGQRVASWRSRDFNALAQELSELLRCPPTVGGLRNALDHMWGYISDYVTDEQRCEADKSPQAKLSLIQQLADAHRVTYLMHSTALSELHMWLSKEAL
uniref:Hypothetical conserved protein n=1 Tax=uncultured Acetothermia bacterium TaxID=236499 RepID=H5SH11_9BACT|nr:hypothetical conserved protein [uncultured Acetothermia bacterium]